jgi:hypothetical protein
MSQESQDEAIFNPLGLESEATLTPDQARQLAVRFGEAHGRSMRALEELADQYGGGQMGTLRGLIEATARRGVITSTDAGRLRKLAGLLDADDAPDMTAIHRLYDEAVRDPGASPAAIATLGVTVDSLDRPAGTTESKKAAYQEGVADGVGTMVGFGLGLAAGLPGGLLGGFAGGTAASDAVHHVAS